MIARKTFVLIAACFATINSSAATDDPARVRAVVDAVVRPLMAAQAIAGMAVGVTVNGKQQYFFYGVASRESQAPVSDATLFELGSISKTLTAALTSYAQVTGKLSLSDHPSKYMPQLTGAPIDKASLLHLGTYTAGGLPLQFPDDVDSAGMVSYFQQFKPTAAPGTQRQYSNPSLGLLSHVTALALKADFADAMQQQLFPQLGLKSSYVRMPAAAMSNYAWGYDQQARPIRMSTGVQADGTYGVRANVSDVLRWVQVNIEPTLLPATMARAVQGTQVGYYQAGEMVQGLGWEQYGYPITRERLLAGNSETMIFDAVPVKAVQISQAASGAVLFNKTGSTSGFGGYVAFVPQQKIGIVMLANKNYPIPARVQAAHGILNKLSAT